MRLEPAERASVMAARAVLRARVLAAAKAKGLAIEREPVVVAVLGGGGSA